jgi:hypothetical protein
VEFQTPGSSGRPPSGKILGTVVLPVPNQISDTNTADWGADSMNAVQAAAAAAAFAGITDGVGAGMESIAETLKQFGSDPTSKTFVAASLPVQPWVVRVLNYYQGQVVKL